MDQEAENMVDPHERPIIKRRCVPFIDKRNLRSSGISTFD